jgi:hypothetical protein
MWASSIPVSSWPDNVIAANTSLLHVQEFGAGLVEWIAKRVRSTAELANGRGGGGKEDSGEAATIEKFFHGVNSL